MKIEEIEESLSDNLHHCLWIDCFCRKVTINILALEELKKMIENNMNKYIDVNTPTDLERFAYKMNFVILDIIEKFSSQDNINNVDQCDFK